MIWEVDENLDGQVDWNEFYLMFVRNINDSSGLEPSQLFSVVQFMMFDKDGGGTVSADECMEMIYMRYGKDQLEAKMADLFAADDGDGELSFAEYLEATNIRLRKKKARPGRKYWRRPA